MGRREQIVECILLVVAESGLKGLTHREVDKRAGLAEGSTGNLFPRRDDLIRAILRRLEARDVASFAEAHGSRASSPDELAALLAHGLEQMLSPEGETLTRVRFTMMLAYPQATEPFHTRLLRTLEKVMARAGVDDDVEERARAVSSCFDGFLFHALSVDPRPVDAQAAARAFRVLLSG
ncbi:TetR/AcrR family transcriptional regulator [Brevibacterium jeotgali]|uniref:Transcriptional regulator, TetR family n=1 Tax=Brevibacterium jeotgali TaxID=1262550 RepID=A0A2H1L2I9_9MICO|nr:TetR family transcriptional regulator [Brevibacterium jeotgali]TWC03094.1 TetR family transcriptional regulator [Brevibacterium jeotgali]SMY11117.1 transcriptional regulator, TetR family [Brevibacterium jeotgali]